MNKRKASSKKPAPSKSKSHKNKATHPPPSAQETMSISPIASRSPNFPAGLSADVPPPSVPSNIRRVEILPAIELPTTTPLEGQPLRWGMVLAIASLSAMLWGSLVSPFASSIWPLPLTSQSTLQFLGVVTRALGVLLAATITLCAIAIPLTANNYTPKLIALFLKNSLNQAMFALLISANILVHLCFVLSGAEHPPVWPLAIAGMMSTTCFLLIIPYAFYVFRDLQPEMIICNIGREIIADLKRVPNLQKKDQIEHIRHRVIQDLKYLSNITLRSIDRHDRDTASFSIDALRCILDHYFEQKEKMPLCWFEVQRSDFLAHSGEMRRQFQENRTFLEGEVMEEFSMILSSSFRRLDDIIRMLSETMSYIGMQAQKHHLPKVLEMTSLYFNTYLRAAISQRQPSAIYMLVYHYRKLAEALMLANPERSIKIAFYLDYYGHQAVRSGMVFVANLVAYDLADLTELAYQRHAPCREQLLQHFLQFDDEDQMRRLPGVIKSHIKLGTALLALEAHKEVDAISQALQRIPPDLLQAAFRQMDCVKHSTYWEVTDRRKHNDFIDPLFRPYFDVLRKKLSL
ncbi:MAG: DUF2254 domain-containing protein [Myxococcales bacterium]|nr:DUF2254 domain-containing protein [Myxococcales bacterium]